MGCRSATTPLTWTELGYLFLALLLLPALAGFGCSTFIPQTTTLTDGEPSPDTAPPGLVERRLDVDLQTNGDLLGLWSAVCSRLSVDPAAGKPFGGVSVEYTDSGTVKWVFIQGAIGADREFNLTWPYYEEGLPAPSGARLETTPSTAPAGMTPMNVTVQELLEAFAAVGPQAVFDKLPAAGARGKYSLTVIDTESYRAGLWMGPVDTAYAWDGRSFHKIDLHDSRYAGSDDYVCVSAYSYIYSTTTSTIREDLYMTTTPFVATGGAAFFIPKK